jgi:hypothetical protein
MKHLVEKQEFEISAPNFPVAQRWEGRAAALLRDVITPALERCFDDASATRATLVINRMEVDLGLIGSHTPRRQIEERVRAAVTRALGEHAPSPAGAASPTLPDGDGAPGFTGRRLSGREAAVECFIEFLVGGRLPWWARTDEVELEGEWAERADPGQLARIAHALSGSAHARERLAQQFSPEFVTRLLRRYEPALANGALAGWRWLEHASARPATSDASLRALRRPYWAYWAGRCVGRTKEEAALVAALARWLDDTPGAATRVIRLLRAGEADGPDDLQRQRALSELSRLLGAGFGGRPRAEDERHPEAGRADRAGPERGAPADRKADGIRDRRERLRSAERGGASGSPTDTSATTRAEAPLDGATDEAPLYAEAAGLVLLHPFFVELFRTQDLWDGVRWTSPSAQHLAVHLVAWLALGDAGVPEFRLIVPKLLCGMSREVPLDTAITLTEARSRSGTELLRAVVGHWAALGRTSIEGLREGFLARAGKVAVREGGWSIVVERRAQDILLDKLPWGIGVARLPWLEGRLIHVNWT